MKFDLNSVLLVIIGLPAAIGILTAIVMRLDRFSRELQYIKLEIGRTRGAERKYWKRKKRRLWLSLLPFYRR